MPAPLDPDKRDAIADAIRAGGKRNDIAREHHVSPSTVTRIGRDLEDKGELDTPAFDRTKTESASRARAKDNALRRAELEAEFLRRAVEELAECDRGMYVGQFGGRDNVWSQEWFEKAPHNVRATMVATAARAAKAAADLAGVGADDTIERTRTLLERLADEPDDDEPEAA